ncbi:serine/threonine-protein phosphatase 4 regulatory subunit 1-like isoform X2 [Contarinia nasturtii]|uniref:serine/threonine-protein phosphatase 4 regulatory subunit 1-like isoform X2 n=1 Tax=Contarinia nasturtii TaxID=265458 RepID=UPI0012D3F3B4|nr:serine/threonine-protein phosphatase 4 regulatory subunit 1-like isoform X2 [Contarinia nasturtii]
MDVGERIWDELSIQPESESSSKLSISDMLTNVATDANEGNRKQCGQVVLDVLKEHPVNDVLENIHQIASTLSMASEDTDSSVRAALVQVIPDIFARCIELGNPELEYFLFDRMLEIVLRFLKNEENMVRETSFASIKVLLLKKYLSASRIEEFVCPTSVQLLNLEGLPEDVVRERHPDAFVIMALLAPIIGADKTREYFLDKFLELCTNENYDVRKMCAVFCPHLCKVMGIEVSEKHLIPAFLRLCEDKVWDVRKAAADSIRIIALLCSHPFRRDKLCPAFYKLMNDSCRWVYRAASESLGLFISSFAKKCILGVAYRPNGDLYIPNPADADYKQHSQTEILSNFESYESWFEKSATAPEYPKNFMQQQKQFNNKIDFDAIVKVSRESSNENPHFSLPETFHNALSFRSYDNHGFSLSITNLLDTFIIQSEHNNGHSHQRIPRSSGHNFDLTSPIMEPINEYHHLRKNTPRDFPMIVRKAMEKQEEENTRKFTIKAKIPRQNAAPHVKMLQEERGTNSFQSLPPPPPAITNSEPDTPSIENAPSSIDFSSAVNSNLSNSLHSNETDNENNKVNNTSDINLNFKSTANEDGAYDGFTYNKRELRVSRFSESSGFSSIPDDDDATGNDFDILKNTETFMNRINTMQLDDYDDTDDDEHNFNNSKEYEDLDQSFVNMGLEDDDSDINSNLNNSLGPTKTTEDDDDEEVFREFNSHQYWYISPDIPVDMDILLEPEEKKMRIQLEEELELRRFDRVKLINYQPKIVPAELIKYFVSLAHSQDSPVVNYYCAYHFPAVVLTLGRKNWPVMCSLLQLLCNHGIDDIRKTMASSIYQIALIIGRKLATQDLVPVYLRFFEDQDKVKVVALKNLSNFLTVIDRPRYDIIVAALSNCLGEYYEAGWRFREEFAQQILILVKSFGDLAWSTHKLNLIGITIKLLRDRVNSIRKIALETMVEICKKLSADECDVICTFLSKHFGSNSNWRHRQIFSEFCHQWMAQETPLYPDVFNDRLFNIACQLVKDPVPNIRMTIARCFALVLSKQYIDTQRYKVTVIILRKMQTDSDPDVSDVALSCDLPSNEDDNNDTTRNLSESSTSNTNISSLSTASTVDMNCTDGGTSFNREGDDSEVSQDSISLYLDTDEKNTSSEDSLPSELLSSQLT